MGDGATHFRVDADAYDRFMGRYSALLAPVFADAAGIVAGMRVLDVGCGPGALASELVARVGAESVAAADPSEPFVEAVRSRLPGIDVRLAPAERLPWESDAFDASLAQLVLHFVGDPEQGLRELRRVTRPGGTVAACTWDSRDEMRLLRTFWDAALAIDASAPDESRMLRFTQPDELQTIFEATGLADVRVESLHVEARYEGFDELWSSVLGGVGPVGAFVQRLDDSGRDALRAELHRRFGEPAGAFGVPARAFAAFGTA
jgi:ubiquinone/menaquinone biosynthesis C-methylase UbiE